MYSIDVDLVLRYLPPMGENGDGIRLNRTFELPFPPSADVSVYSKSWEGIDDPIGYRLKEITWDIDRSCFLAETEISSSGLAIGLIPHEILSLIEQGWQYGSYIERYRADRRRGRKRAKLPARAYANDHNSGRTCSACSCGSNEIGTGLRILNISEIGVFGGNCAICSPVMTCLNRGTVGEPSIRWRDDPLFWQIHAFSLKRVGVLTR